MVIVITGPTGTGKTELSLFLAKKLKGEVINADSTQFYKGLDIATNKIKDKKGIVHHLFDITDITQDYTVFDYQKDARACINDILERGETPILVGGSGLYIKAALYNYEFESKENNDYEGISNDELYKRLLEVDPDTNIHLNNRVRVISALNYYEANHKPYSEKSKNEELLYDTLFIGLTAERDMLYYKINKRVEAMMEDGLLDEARSIYDSGIRTKAVMTPIGYKELFDYFDGQKDLNECLELIKQKSRNYAKRQYTWFNNQMDLKWFNVNYENFLNTENEILEYITNRD
ncbi:MAG: tRNA (adenosine(37)-N6)-dimethylallyltransferase MiaA [Bacilli bacterium]